MVNLPNWLVTALRIDGDAWLDLARDEVLRATGRSWTCARASSPRQLRLRDAAGPHHAVAQRRLVSMADPHVAALETTVTAENWSGRLTVRSGLDGRCATRGVARYRGPGADAPAPRERPVPRRRVGPARWWRPRSRGIRVGRAARTAGRRARRRDRRCAAGRPRARLRRRTTSALELSPGAAVTRGEGGGAVHLPGPGHLEPAEAARRRARPPPTASTGCWPGTRWRGTRSGGRWRVELAGARRGARRASACTCSTCSRPCRRTPSTSTSGVPARGLHGEAYRGHVFWDELFVLPFLNLRLPELARPCCATATGGCRRRAGPRGTPASAGRCSRGSAAATAGRRASGCTSTRGPGRWLPDRPALQRHVGLAVAYNVWQYYQATGDGTSCPSTAPRCCWRSPGSCRPRRTTTRPPAATTSAGVDGPGRVPHRLPRRPGRPGSTTTPTPT